MAKKNELRARDLHGETRGFEKRIATLRLHARRAEIDGKDDSRARRGGDSLWWAVKETLDDMAAGRDNPKYECEVCGKFVCVFCGAACACCDDVRTCRECAETYENFTFCESCNLAYCNDDDEYGDEA